VPHDDLGSYVSADGFGEPATIGAATVYGIFDAASFDSNGIMGEAPFWSMPEASLPVGTDVGDEITIRSRAYGIAEIRPDGTGWVILKLENS